MKEDQSKGDLYYMRVKDRIEELFNVNNNSIRKTIKTELEGVPHVG